MIDPQWEVVDLDPITWRNLGRFINPGQFVRAGSPEEHALYVLHDDGRLLNVVDSRTGKRRDLELGEFIDPAVVAEQLHATGEWERVHVIDRRHLLMTSAQMQWTPEHDITLDQYFKKVYDQVWNRDDGYVAVPPHSGHWNHWSYSAVQAWVADLPSPSAIALGVVGDRLEIGVIAIVRGGLIRKLTTFEALPIARGAAAVSEAYLDSLWGEIGSRLAPVSALMVCDAETFEAWITGENKSAVIRDAIGGGRAYLRGQDRALLNLTPCSPAAAE